MPKELVISMVEPKEKLRNLNGLPGNLQRVVGPFGRYLADYLNDELIPMGFVLGCCLAIADLQNGRKISKVLAYPELTDYSPVVYAFMLQEIPAIAERIFPAEFAEEVKKIYKDFKASN